MSLTEQQQRAVEARGKTIVSAAAGSGKTHVMVTRFVRLITEEHADVRNMLAVTFTNKAAAQMRDRIRRALLEGIANSEGERREFLTGQLRNLPLADICTIHAYCGRLLRTFFYLIGIDPAFRIVGGEDAEGLALSGRAMDRVFEDAYEGNVAGFENLLDVFFRKKDASLKQLVLELYGKVRSDAHYRDMLSKIAAGGEDTFAEAEDLLFAEYGRRIVRCLDGLHALGEKLPAFASPKLDAYYTELEEAIRYACGAADLYDMAVRTACELKCRLPSEEKISDPAEARVTGALKGMRKQFYGIRDIVKGYHARDEEREKYLSSQKQVTALAALTLAYDEAYTAVKREAGVLDYEDLEHLAIALLGREEVRGALKEKYDYVFVDEYQDVNSMQEEIISLLAGKDVFLVGDLKQAIYAFRGSKSVFFAQKEREFAESGNCLPLSANFRSAEAILGAVNTVFSAALGDRYTTLGGGTLYGDHCGEVIVHYLGEEEPVETAERGVYSVKKAAAAAKTDATAERVAAIIEEECGARPGLGREFFDTTPMDPPHEKEARGLQKVTYGDIAVLVRKNRQTAAAVVRALAERGIPVTAEAKINICDYFEVRLLLDWLSFLDNPAQDIPMASAMLSVIGGFSDGELSAIRLYANGAGAGGSFREACKLYASGNTDAVAEKLAAFGVRVQRYRDLMCVHTASEMLTTLLADGLEAQIAAKGESEVRLGRVRRLIAESENSDDVHSFLARLRDCDYKVDLSEAGGENAVHVLTMHAAKGLEFPVVILIDLDDKIRGLDLRKDLLWTDKFHIVLRAYDLQKKTYRDTLLRQASKEYAMREAVDGELNLLYVAMTRARYRMHLVFSDGAPAYATAEEELAAYSVPDAERLSDFIPRLLLGATAEDIATIHPVGAGKEPVYRSDPAEAERIKRAMRPYAHEGGTRVPVKDSATGLLGRRAPMYREEAEENEAPMSEMSTEDAGMGRGYSAEVGTAYHAFLEHVNFGEDAVAELARMREEHILPPEQLALLDADKLSAILSMPHLRGLKGKKTYREQRFLARFPAGEFASSYGAVSDEEVLYQGAIDLLVEEGGGEYSVIDYKFSAMGAEKLRAHYAVQLKLYRMTVARIMKTDLSHVKVYLVNIARGYEVLCP